MRLIYIDDDRINTVLFEAACTDVAAVEWRCADAPGPGLALARDWPAALWVIDLNLPGTDGFELLRKLRALPGQANTLAVLCSADLDPALPQQARQAGFTTCWPKPVNAAALRAGLSALGLLPPSHALAH